MLTGNNNKNAIIKRLRQIEKILKSILIKIEKPQNKS